MRLARVGPAGAEQPVAVAADGSLLDLRPLTADIDGTFLSRGLPAARAAAEAGVLQVLPSGPPRHGPPVARPGKIVGIGLNYAGHAAEAGVPVPTEPVVFLKAPSALSGPTDPIRPVPGSSTTDYEVELAVVLGATVRAEGDPGRALAAVAGYALANDVSDRELQLDRGGTWAKGKCADTFCPLGPWLVTPEELGDPQALTLQLSVNGRSRQHASTGDMIFTVAELLCALSSLMTLEPGDVVLTGTPAGVAMGRPEPRPYLRDGDVVELTATGLGTQRTPVAVGAARTLTTPTSTPTPARRPA